MKCFTVSGASLRWGWQSKVHKRAFELGFVIRSSKDHAYVVQLIAAEEKLAELVRREARLAKERRALKARLEKLRGQTKPRFEC